MEGLGIILSLVLVVTCPCYGDSMYGKSVGSFPANSAHEVAGDLFAVDDSTLRVVNFDYDGEGPDAFFWFGTESNNPDGAGIILPYPTSDMSIILGEYRDADLLLKLPSGYKVNDIKWLSVWCRAFGADFGHIKFPSDPIIAPKPVDLNTFPDTATHQVRASKITILDGRRITLEQFNYDGEGPDAFIMVGSGAINAENGVIVPNEMGSTEKLGAYTNQDITVMLPEGTTFYDVEWLSIYCKSASVSFADVQIPAPLNVPPYLSMMSYFGHSLGPLEDTTHGVSGDVYIVDSKRIGILNFNYDGEGPDAFFYIGKKNVHSPAPSENGMIIPDENGSTEKLPEYMNDDVILTLPDGVTVTDINWLSVWCREAKVNFGSVMFSMITVPAPVNLGPIPTGGHQFRADQVNILDTKRVEFVNIHYDGLGPDAFFLAGKGPINKDTGTKVPDENGFLTKLKAYSGQTIVITLPGLMTVNDIDWISMYCIQAKSNFGHINLPEEMYPVPPYIAPPATTFPNCEQMNEDFNVAWRIDGDDIEFEFSGALDGSDGYMAFGISGSPTRSQMGNSDPMVVYLDNDTPKLVDYSVDDSYSLCSNGVGVCPDVTRATPGTDDLTLLKAYVNDGVTRVTFKRPLAATNSDFDHAIPKNSSVYIVWAMGNVNDQNMVTKHKQRTLTDKQLDFSRSPTSNCQTIKGVVEEAVTPWDIPLISGETTKIFNAKIGPTGGKQGYEGITGQTSWGIAWYINGVLIPELAVKRGDTYTFKVEGGADPSQAAKYHPLYITDDPKGGYHDKTPEERQGVKLFAGTFENATGVFGTDGRYCEYISSDNAAKYDTFEEFRNSLRLECDDGKPAGVFSWTVARDTPDRVYYQCFTHNYLGWKIQVVNDYSEISGGISLMKNSASFISIIILTVIKYLL